MQNRENPKKEEAQEVRSKEESPVPEDSTSDISSGDVSANVTFIDDTKLEKLELRPSLPLYLRQMWRRRHFVRSYARSTAFGSGRNTYLGKVWIILDPVLQVSIYALIFGFVLQVSRGIDNFIGFLIIGVTYFRFLSSGLTTGSGLIQRSKSLISSFNFPRAAVAFSAIFRNFLDGIAPAVLGVVLALAFQWSNPLSWTVLLVPVFYILIHIFGVGVTLIIARATAFIPDLKSFVKVLTQGLFFLSGIFYSIDRFAEGSIIQTIMKLNPFYQFLSAVRICVLDGEVPPLELWISLLSWSIGTAVIGLFFFWRAEAKYAYVK